MKARLRFAYAQDQPEGLLQAIDRKPPITMTPINTVPVKLFDFTPGLPLRSITKDAAPWFVAVDVCTALGHTNVSKAVAAHVDPEDKANDSLGLPGRAPLIVNESGLYALILRSNKPEAKKFQKWITSVVLPALRRDSLYVVGQEKPITDDLTLPELMAQIVELQSKVDARNAAQVRAWSRHQEEKQARRDGFRLLKRNVTTARGRKAAKARAKAAQ